MSDLDVMLAAEDVPDFDELAAQAATLDPDTAVRHLLLRLIDLERRRDLVKAQAADITSIYRTKVAGIEEQIERARDSIHVCITRKGDRVVWPDLGAAYLTKKGASVEVTDRERFQAWAFDRAFVKPVLDESAAKRAAVESVEAGEEIPPGVDYVAASERLTVRIDLR